jgi:hypothetical protein
MHEQTRRRDLLARRANDEQVNHPLRRSVLGDNWAWAAIRAGILLLVVLVIAGAWTVSSAHLGEQILAAPRQEAGLIDPTANQFSLSPDSIEQQFLSLSLRLREGELYQPVGVNPLPRPFRIQPGEPARFIAARLEQEGFVGDADLFNLYLRVTGLERNIEAGNFMLAETMTMPEVAESLQNALFEETLVTLPEGMRAEEIAERLSEANVIEGDRFLAAVRNPRSLSIFDNYDFLQNLPATASLEGFLFPDTYRFPCWPPRPNWCCAPSSTTSRIASAPRGWSAAAAG